MKEQSVGRFVLLHVTETTTYSAFMRIAFTGLSPIWDTYIYLHPTSTMCLLISMQCLIGVLEDLLETSGKYCHGRFQRSSRFKANRSALGQQLNRATWSSWVLTAKKTCSPEWPYILCSSIKRNCSYLSSTVYGHTGEKNHGQPPVKQLFVSATVYGTVPHTCTWCCFKSEKSRMAFKKIYTCTLHKFHTENYSSTFFWNTFFWWPERRDEAHLTIASTRI